MNSTEAVIKTAENNNLTFCSKKTIFISYIMVLNYQIFNLKSDNMKSAGSFFGGLLAGAAIGAVLALLYAPKSGEDTRKDIKRTIGNLEEELESLKIKLKEKGGELKEDIKKRIEEIENRIAHLTAEYRKES